MERTEAIAHYSVNPSVVVTFFALENTIAADVTVYGQIFLANFTAG